jgi:Cys-tRNA synthase (O-phospho-L-seryl-tRNA:Cys-tRNA synthase)
LQGGYASLDPPLKSQDKGGFIVSDSENVKQRGRKRNKHVDLKLTESEFKELEKRAKETKLSKQEFIYRATFNKEIVVLQNGIEIVRELIRIGVNINQLAKVANSSEFVDPEKIEKLRGEVRCLWQSLNLSRKKMGEA